MISSSSYRYKIWLFLGSVFGVLKFHNIRVMKNTFDLQNKLKESIGAQSDDN